MKLGMLSDSYAQRKTRPGLRTRNEQGKRTTRKSSTKCTLCLNVYSVFGPFSMEVQSARRFAYTSTGHMKQAAGLSMEELDVTKVEQFLSEETLREDPHPNRKESQARATDVHPATLSNRTISLYFNPVLFFFYIQSTRYLFSFFQINFFLNGLDSFFYFFNLQAPAESPPGVAEVVLA